MTAKKILLLDTGKEWGGGTNSMFELLKRIDRNRFAVTPLFYANYPKGGSDLRQEFAQFGFTLQTLAPPRQPAWAKLAKELTRGLLHFLPALRRRALHAIERRWRIDPLARQLAARLRAGGYDLLYMNNQPSSNLEGYLAAERAGVPVVQHCRIEVTLQPEETRVVNRVARAILCVSEGVRESLVARGVTPSLCHVVHNAIDGGQALPAPVALPGYADGEIVIGAVGSLIRRKANHHLLQAVARIAAEAAVPFRVVLVGEGPELAPLVAQVRELGLGGRVVFAGFQRQPLPWMAAMDIVVLASAKEGLPRVLLEAMLLGKPVVASAVVGSRELVRDGDNGLLFPYGDVAALAAALRTLLASTDLRRRMGEAGRAIVLRDHSITHYVQAVEAQLAAAA